MNPQQPQTWEDELTYLLYQRRRMDVLYARANRTGNLPAILQAVEQLALADEHPITAPPPREHVQVAIDANARVARIASETRSMTPRQRVEEDLRRRGVLR